MPMSSNEEEIYEAVKLAARTGKVKKGVNESTKAIEQGIAKLVIVAKNIDPPELVMHIPELAKEKKVPFVYVSSKEKLGEAVGIKSASSVVIVEPGEAASSISKFAKV
ncbi:MAG: ribosomal L7Ae/L30e/S12e/Gadd45 family protein [Candidatus Korarchaeota archaeon]